MGPLRAYFHAERTESLGFMGAGLAALIVGIWWAGWMPYKILVGAAWPFIFIGSAQFLAGMRTYVRSARLEGSLTALLDESPDAFRVEELDRMHRVSQNFIRVRWIEIALFILSGLLLLVFFPLKGPWFGFAITLGFESAFSLVLDFFSEERAYHYREFVRHVA